MQHKRVSSRSIRTPWEIVCDVIGVLALGGLVGTLIWMSFGIR